VLETRQIDNRSKVTLHVQRRLCRRSAETDGPPIFLTTFQALFKGNQTLSKTDQLIKQAPSSVSIPSYRERISLAKWSGIYAAIAQNAFKPIKEAHMLSDLKVHVDWKDMNSGAPFLSTEQRIATTPEWRATVYSGLSSSSRVRITL